jgi:hypothetical protein
MEFSALYVVRGWFGWSVHITVRSWDYNFLGLAQKTILQVDCARTQFTILLRRSLRTWWPKTLRFSLWKWIHHESLEIVLLVVIKCQFACILFAFFAGVELSLRRIILLRESLHLVSWFKKAGKLLKLFFSESIGIDCATVKAKVLDIQVPLFFKLFNVLLQIIGSWRAI